jgi:replicative DNA helicase
MLLDPLRILAVARLAGVTPDSFYVAGHRMLAAAIWDMAAKGDAAVDAVTVQAKLRSAGVEGVERLVEGCIDAAFSVEHGPSYLENVRNYSLLRSVADVASGIARDAYEKEDGLALVRTAPALFFDLLPRPRDERNNEEVMQAALQAWRDAKGGKKPAIGLNTPWGKLTTMICGWEPGLTVVGGRPSAGKTTFEDQVACDILQTTGRMVARFTLDSSRDELLQRMLCRMAGVSLPKMKFGFSRESQLASVEQAIARAKDWPNTIDDHSRNLQEILTQARYLKARYDIAAVTVDYIQQIRTPELGREANDPVQRVAHVSGALKQLALDLNIPVVALAQLSRRVEAEGRDPQMSDLRDSGALEQDAHKIIMLVKDTAKAEAMDEARREATKHKRPVKCAVVKQKNGATGEIPMWLFPPYFRFTVAGVDAKTGEAWVDDAMPAEADKDDSEGWSQMEDYLPQSLKLDDDGDKGGGR